MQALSHQQIADIASKLVRQSGLANDGAQSPSHAELPHSTSSPGIFNQVGSQHPSYPHAGAVSSVGSTLGLHHPGVHHASPPFNGSPSQGELNTAHGLNSASGPSHMPSSATNYPNNFPNHGLPLTTLPTAPQSAMAVPLNGIPPNAVSPTSFNATPYPGLPTSSGAVPSSTIPTNAIPSTGVPHGGLPPQFFTGLQPNISAPFKSTYEPIGAGPISLPTGNETPVSGKADTRLRDFVEQVRRGTFPATPTADSKAIGSPAPIHLPIGASAVNRHRSFDVNQVRADFPALHQLIHGKPLVWLDNAATTHKPQSVIDSLSHYYENDYSNIHRAAHTLAARSTDAYEAARGKVRRFINASTVEEIIFVRGTTEGINLIANTCASFLSPGDEILLSTLEHHANIVPWQIIAKAKGARIRSIPINDRGEIIQSEYQRLLGPRTRLVSLTQASNSLGTIVPVEEMTHLAHRMGARVLIDGAQSVPHMTVDVQKIGCDFFVFSGHKIFAPTGIGAVYIHRDLHELLPPWQGGGNMIRTVTFEETTYSPAPAKFEAGTPNIADAIGLGAAIDYMSQFDIHTLEAYEHSLLAYATERLIRIPGLTMFGTAAEKVGVISFILQNKRVEQVGQALDQEGIAVRSGHHCAQPSLRRFGLEATVRPSFTFYNTFEEIDRLADAVTRIATRL